MIMHRGPGAFASITRQQASREWDEPETFSDEDLFDERGGTRVWSPSADVPGDRVGLDGPDRPFERVDTGPGRRSVPVPDTGRFETATPPGPGLSVWAAAARRDPPSPGPARPRGTPPPGASARAPVRDSAPTPMSGAAVVDDLTFSDRTSARARAEQSTAPFDVVPAEASDGLNAARSADAVPAPRRPAPSFAAPTGPMPSSAVARRRRATGRAGAPPERPLAANHDFGALPGARLDAPSPPRVRFRGDVDDLIASYVDEDIYADDFRRQASIKRILAAYIDPDEKS